MKKLKPLTHLLSVITLLFFLIFCEEKLSPEPTKANKYGQVLSELHKRGQFNGNALIVENGEIAYQGSFGIRSIDPVDSLTQNSVFRLGSVSKTFTAMGIMILKEQGKLQYDQDIRDQIPELPYENITIRHLLNHVSGLPDYTTLMDTYWMPEVGVDNPVRAISGNEDAIKMLADKHPPVHFKPMEKWEYSNTGYMLLATIVSRASEMPFDDFLNENIFKPTGMMETSVYKYVNGNDTNMPDRAYGFYEGLDGQMITTDYHYLNNAQGDGGIYSTLGDLFKWDRILYTNELISEETKNEAYTPATLNNGQVTPYGFGWFVEKSLKGKKVVQHSGGWAGFITHLFREIEDNNCIILLTNNNSQYFNISNTLLSVLHNQPYELPKLLIFEKIGKVAMTKGADTAIALYKTLKKDSMDTYIFDERPLNVLGYELLYADKIDDAVKIFQLNTEEYPKSANVFDSYGDGLLEKGDTLNALISFKKTVALDSTFSIAKEKIEKLEGDTRHLKDAQKQ